MEQAKIEEMIANDEAGQVCEWDNSLWIDLVIPPEHIGVWNLVTEGLGGPIDLVKMSEFKPKPSVQMGDTVEAVDGWRYGTVMKYST